MKRFKVDDHVTWNSEAGYVSGTIIKVHVKDVNYNGHMHRCTTDDPQYEIKSSKTDHRDAQRVGPETHERLKGARELQEFEAHAGIDAAATGSSPSETATARQLKFDLWTSQFFCSARLLVPTNPSS